jgi:hypothetical protein
MAEEGRVTVGFATMRRLYERGPTCRGLAVDEDGVMLGPDGVLVRRTPLGYRSADPGHLALLTRAAFGEDRRLRRLPIVLDAIAQALDRGDLVKAQLLGLELPLGELDDRSLRRVSVVADLIKAGFDPDQPRDERGRWTDASAAGAAAARMTRPPAAKPAAPSVFGRVAPAVLDGLAAIGARFSAATAFLGIIFIPTNRSLLTEGTLPERPEVRYRYDQEAGTLELFRFDEQHQRQVIVAGRADADGVFRDDEGRALGRKLDSSVIVDPDALPEAARRSDNRQNEPKACPAPTEENIAGRKERALAYQEQITGLPRGLSVKLWSPEDGKYIDFDGCRESDGTMLEAKGPGYLKHFRERNPFVWTNMERELDEQAGRQFRAAKAANRPSEWYFAEEPVADHFKERWKGKYSNITVKYVAPRDGR